MITAQSILTSTLFYTSLSTSCHRENGQGKSFPVFGLSGTTSASLGIDCIWFQLYEIRYNNAESYQQQRERVEQYVTFYI